MQIVIDISEEDYQKLKALDQFDDMYLNYYEKLIAHGALLPSNATNGDVIKALFNIPDNKIEEGKSTTYIYTKTNILKGNSQDHLREQISFNKDWWNAPYKKDML